MLRYLGVYIFLILLPAYDLTAQQIPCFFDEYNEPGKLVYMESRIQKGVQKILLEKRSMDSLKIIPVVVHVIHNGGSENISEAQIHSQIQVLNEDYGKKPGSNGDGNGVDTGIRFFLANLDPYGRCTNGIVRIKSPLTNHQAYQRALLKELSFWDNTRYLNIYVVKSINGGVGGYSSFPGGPPDEDGVVVRHNRFGRIGTASASLGRTPSHELGHWFGLYHTFNNACGDDVCTGGDFVCDTPPALEPNFSCTTRNTCHNDVPDVNDLKENYMDYTPDACKNMFTEGQKMRMRAALNEIRTNIWSDENLLNAGYDSVFSPPAVCPVAADFVTLTREICFGNTVHFIDKSLNAAVSWQWRFPGGTPAVSTEPNPKITYNIIGDYDVTLIVSDSVTTDSLILESYIHVGEPGMGDALSYAEDFETGLYPPAGIIINNPDGGVTWELDSMASTSGKYSIRINNLINTNYGTVDEIIFPYLDFTSVAPDSTLFMSFNWAYAKSDPIFSDELLVLLSTDCGTNFTRVFYKAGNALATGPTQTTPFIPDAGQWKSAFINLDGYKDASYVQLKIANVTDGGNNLYIDDLYVGNGSDLVSANEILVEGENLKIYPNPASDRLNIWWQFQKPEALSVKLFNIQGSILRAIPERTYPAGRRQASLFLKGIPAGVYIVVLESDGYRKAVKVMVVHP